MDSPECITGCECVTEKAHRCVWYCCCNNVKLCLLIYVVWSSNFFILLIFMIKLMASKVSNAC